MSEWLKKEQALFSRDENGKLLPVDGELEDIEGTPKIKFIPMARGEIQSLFLKMSSQKEKAIEISAELVSQHCIEPSFTIEEVLKNGVNKIISSIENLIMSRSLGMNVIDYKTMISSSDKKSAMEDYLKKK